MDIYDIVKDRLKNGDYEITSMSTHNSYSVPSTEVEILINDLFKYSKKTKNFPNYLNIKKVIFNNPATIIYWLDGSRTVVKCGSEDVFDKEKGLAMAITKRAFGDKGNYNDVFKKWCK